MIYLIVHFQLYIFLFILNLLVPKSKKIISIASKGGKSYSGNAKAFYEYMKNDKYFSTYYFIRDKKKYEEISKLDENILYYYSSKALFILLRSKTVLITHGLLDFIGLLPIPSQRIILLYHGLPSKVDLFLSYNDLSFTEKTLRFINWLFVRKMYMIVNSKFERYFYSSKLRLNANRIFITGYPRNDLFTRLIKHKKKRNNTYNILYAPTWRENKPTKIFPFKDMNIDDLCDFLKKYNIKIYIRFHLNNCSSSKSQARKFFQCKNIVDYSPDKIEDIQNFLIETDLLITDYSSIYQDFLLVDRPTLFIPYDLTSTEGIYEPLGYDFYYPGPKVRSFREFVNTVEEIYLGKDRYKKNREMLKSVLFQYNDSNSSKRVKNLIMELN